MMLTKNLTIQQRIKVANYNYDDRCDFSWSQIDWIIRLAADRLDGKVLFFGSGYDSLMWSRICDAIFLEDNRRRYRKLFANPEHQHFVAYLLTYYTRVKDWKQNLADEMVNTLPPEVEQSRFDVVVVDGPRGGKSKDPGRVSSILHAARLVKPGGMIFVDDLNRELEREVTREVLGIPTATHHDRTLLACWNSGDKK